jgi:integrase
MRVRASIDRAIQLGTFDLAEFFPHSKRAAAKVATNFGDVAADWLASKGQMADATRDQYRLSVNFWRELLGAGTPMDALTFQRLAKVIGEHPWASAKSANNRLIPLRGIFEFHYSGPRAAQNPMAGIKNLKVVKKLPDPLTAGERDAILGDLAKHYDPRVLAYFQFAFFTGMRPEELIALQWGDIDGRRSMARVQRVRTFKGSERDGSKTHAERDVDLVPEALAALQIMRPWTSMQGEAAAIFQNPVTGKPWHDERSQRDHYWKPALKRLRIRSRRPYCTRHTFATVALMGGVNPAYIAAQLGHATPKTTFDKYARWISDGGAAAKVLAQALATKPAAGTLQQAAGGG